MDNNSANRERYAHLWPRADGKLQTEWTLTDTKLLDSVKISMPPAHVVPIIFVPGIMGSNLCDLKGNPVWLLNGTSASYGLAWDWIGEAAGARQKLLHPKRTMVYLAGAVPKKILGFEATEKDYLKRGWGEVSEASYHKFLVWLETKMNLERNPASWEDFSNASLPPPSTLAQKMFGKLPAGLAMQMRGLPKATDDGRATQQITSDELLKRAKSKFPVYACGYNWLASNDKAAQLLAQRVERVISENNRAPFKCTQVILVTHSMGGLVVRACAQLPGMAEKIVGVVHGVMPATGAAVAYRRCKVGMLDEDAIAGRVIGATGLEVTAVFAQAPGALQLLPSEGYGAEWLEIHDDTGKVIQKLPNSDPYTEIYLQKEKWWGLVREEWTRPQGGIAIDWNEFSKNVLTAKAFHKKISGKYHRKTFVFYGGGSHKNSFSNVQWKIKRGTLPQSEARFKSVSEILKLAHADLRTDGSNSLYVGGKKVVTVVGRGDSPHAIETETSHWHIWCAKQDGPGDGTVPLRSGCEPRKTGGLHILQQFLVPNIEHEPAYSKYPIAQSVAYYAVTKLAAIAERP